MDCHTEAKEVEQWDLIFTDRVQKSSNTAALIFLGHFRLLPRNGTGALWSEHLQGRKAVPCPGFSAWMAAGVAVLWPASGRGILVSMTFWGKKRNKIQEIRGSEEICFSGSSNSPCSGAKGSQLAVSRLSEPWIQAAPFS